MYPFSYCLKEWICYCTELSKTHTGVFAPVLFRDWPRSKPTAEAAKEAAQSLQAHSTPSRLVREQRWAMFLRRLSSLKLHVYFITSSVRRFDFKLTMKVWPEETEGQNSYVKSWTVFTKQTHYVSPRSQEGTSQRLRPPKLPSGPSCGGPTACLWTAKITCALSIKGPRSGQPLVPAPFTQHLEKDTLVTYQATRVRRQELRSFPSRQWREVEYLPRQRQRHPVQRHEGLPRPTDRNSD